METSFHKILVPTDFSADAEHAMRLACELSAEYHAPLTLIHIYDPVSYPLPDIYVLNNPGQLSRMWAEFDRRLAQAKADAEAAGAQSPQTRFLEGLTAAEIVRFAKDEGYDLIVMGTHGRTGVARVLLGSVAARVVQTAGCAVLTVKRPGLPAVVLAGEPIAAAPAT